MTVSINPYRSPSTATLDRTPDPQPADYITDRLRFRGHVTTEQHRLAVTKTGIRVDYLSTGMILITLATFAGLVGLAIALIPGNIHIAGFLSVTLMLLVLAVFQFNHQRLVASQIPQYQFTVGPIEGWIDSKELVIQSPRFMFYCPVDQITGTACDGHLWAISFHRTFMFWQTLPIDAFENPHAARAVAADLQHLRPAKSPQLFDPRPQREPESDFRFQSGENALFYRGWFRHGDAEGARLLAATRRVARRGWLLFGAMFVCLMASVVTVTGMDWEYSVIMGCWMIGVVVALLLKRWRSLRSHRKDGDGSLWFSKGWIDDDGYCSMTTLGQSRMLWPFFNHYEITDKAIVLYPHATDACACLIGRSQFSDEDWPRATDKVRQRMPT